MASTNIPNVPMLPESEKFDGTGWPIFKTRIFANLKVCGLGGYVDGTIPKPRAPVTVPPPAVLAVEDTDPNPYQRGSSPFEAVSTALPPEPTSVFSKSPSLEEWIYRDGVATSILILNVKDPVGLGLKTDGTAREAWQLLEDIYGRVSDIGLS
ncbi:Retrovirus-related pol polyprotein [Mycena venus]|uniref:Retrovirus-related pol polyprotein n=1 Tax=Mycena venus TaxID=2733690 RepID=A0A8H7DEN4_9AGAR|nr:Retrovirus-related pol polyprotein [Mycena venus]